MSTSIIETVRKALDAQNHRQWLIAYALWNVVADQSQGRLQKRYQLHVKFCSAMMDARNSSHGLNVMNAVDTAKGVSDEEMYGMAKVDAAQGWPRRSCTRWPRWPKRRKDEQ